MAGLLGICAKNGVGADAWHRTGVLTFNGNRCLSNKVTYSRIKEHLEKDYNTTFSYGTVVQLDVAGNKGRKSSKNYKGLARVTFRCTRKGFTIRYNPDQHWSSVLYPRWPFKTIILISLRWLETESSTFQI